MMYQPADFYPRSPCGERQKPKQPRAPTHYFYPRSPCGERLGQCFAHYITNNISIHALLAESDQAANGLADTPPQISIHALLAESDGAIGQLQCIHGNFYPRSPCGERQAVQSTINIHRTFLSTLSLRRATNDSRGTYALSTYFYPRSPCGERPIVDNIVLMPGEFLSTLSLRRATHSRGLNKADVIFLSTLSLRRATFKRWCVRNYVDISIHALLAESDSWRGAFAPRNNISIHALLAESDLG